MFHIVLLEPEIPWNTGNIGRTCLAAGARLHLVGRLGFHLDEKQVKRAGLDYWEKVDLARHDTWEVFLDSLPPKAQLFFFSTKGRKTLWQAAFPKDAYLVFGKETAGFPKKFHERYGERMYRIPQVGGSVPHPRRPQAEAGDFGVPDPEQGPVRSLNLSTSVGIALYEALRQDPSRRTR